MSYGLLEKGWNLITLGYLAPVQNEIPKQKVNSTVLETFQNGYAKNPCWTEMKITNQVKWEKGPKGGVARSIFTPFGDKISCGGSRTIEEPSCGIRTASWYGARPWNGSIWFSAIDSNNNSGVLSMEHDSEGKSTFYPIPGLSSTSVPLVIPSHSQAGPEGYVCIYEADLGLVGFSLWDLNDTTPKKLFEETGFEGVFFFGDSDVIAFRQETKAMEWWDLKTRKPKHIFTDWYKPGEFFMGIGPMNQKAEMVLAGNGPNLFGFDLMKKQLRFSLTFQGKDDALFDRGLIGDNFFYVKEESTPNVQVFTILTGQVVAGFTIGGGSNNFPMRVYENGIFALKNDDQKIPCLYNPANGEVEMPFEPAPQNISELYCSKEHLIGKSYDPPLVMIWDMDDGKLLQTIKAPVGYNTMSVRDITDGKLTLFVDQNNSKKLETTKAQPEKKRLDLVHQNDKNIHWSERDFMVLNNNSIRLEIWDIDNASYLGTIEEKFTPPTNGFPILANYSEGRLVLDNSTNVLLQTFKV